MLPLNKFLLIETEGRDQETSTGILIPNITFESLEKGTVVEIWPETENEHGIPERSQVKPGDNVLFLYKEKEKRLTTNLNNKELYLIQENEVVAIL